MIHWPVLRARLIAYWDRKRGDRIAPARPEIDPLDLARVLPHVALIDVLDGIKAEAATFRYRLVGEHINEQTGRRLAGETVGPAFILPGLHEACATAAAQASIETIESEFLNASGVYKRLSAVLLPLSTDGERVDTLLVGAMID